MRQTAAFVALTFAISWGAWGAAILTGSDAAVWRVAGAFGPTLAALVVVLWSGPQEVRRLLSSFTYWRAPAWVWAFAIFSTAALGLTALGIHSLLGGTPEWPGAGVLALTPVVFLWVLAFSVAGEEIGWRGWLLPRLLDRTGPVRASLAVGLVWAIWHLPLWALPGDFHAAIPLSLFFVQILAISILYTWIWLNSGGSLIVAHVFHAASNTTLGILPLIPGEGADSLQPLWIAVGLLCLLAVAVAFRLARIRGPAMAMRGP